MVYGLKVNYYDFTSLIGITGLVLSTLGNTSRKYLQISGSYLYLEYFAFLGGDKNTGVYKNLSDNLSIHDIYWGIGLILNPGLRPLINWLRFMRQRCMGSPYNGSLKNILEKFYEGPLDGFFILCRERGWLGNGYIPMWYGPFRKSLSRGA